MKTNNYFACGREAFFFNDRSLESTRNAYDAARIYRDAVGTTFRFAVYRKPQISGEWDDVRPVEGGVH